MVDEGTVGDPSLVGQLFAIREQMLQLKEMLGADIRGVELVKRLTVDLRDANRHDFDTYILFSDEERDRLRRLDRLAEDMERRDEGRAARRAWHMTWWGRSVGLAAIFGAIYPWLHAVMPHVFPSPNM